MLIDEERTWAGSESSLKAVLEADAKIATQAMSPQEDDDEDEDDTPRGMGGLRRHRFRRFRVIRILPDIGGHFLHR